MEIFFYFQEKEAPFDGPYRHINLQNALLISNDQQVIADFATHKERIINEAIGNFITDKMVFVPEAVRDTFLNWIKEKYKDVEWKSNKTLSVLGVPEIFGGDELNDFFRGMKVMENWKSEDNIEPADEEDINERKSFSDWLKDINVIFYFVLVIVILIGIYNNFWLDKKDDSQPVEMIMLFDQTNSVVPSNEESKLLVSKIAQAVGAFFSQENKIDSDIWSIEKGDEKQLKQTLQSIKKLRLIGFGGIQLNSSTKQCEMSFTDEKSLLSNSSDLSGEIEVFYNSYIYDRDILKKPDHESPQLAQWQAWKDFIFQQKNPQQQNYYQIVVTDGEKSEQKGGCLNNPTIETRLNEWNEKRQEDLLILKYKENENLTMKVSKISFPTTLPDSTLSSSNYKTDQLEHAVNQLKYTVNNLWVLIAAILVILMQAGFALVEAGFNASKNVVNIMFKNVMDFALGILFFFIIGFTLMFGQSFYGLWGFDALMLNVLPKQTGDISPYIYFLFQAAFAATAATICAGSVAGRLRFEVYLIYSIVITAIVYPISGHWAWNDGGWLKYMGFEDFAGSVVVHAVGGFAGLAGALILKSRLGQFKYEGDLDQNLKKELYKRKSELFPHNLSLAALGMLILWIGWYGFNGGSEFAIYGESVDRVAKVAVNTTLAAATGAVTVMLIMFLRREKLELTLMLNGAIGGLVAITASCHKVAFGEAILIGWVAGIVVMLGVELLVKLRIDDPVGAWPVHGLCGIWGGIAYGIFGHSNNFFIQLIGSILIPMWSFIMMLLLFWTLNELWKRLEGGGIRVPAKEELKGLDNYHHGEKAFINAE